MKKIINTIMGVLVRWYWNIHDAIVTIYKVLQFRFHFIENYKESLEFDKKEEQFNEKQEDLKETIDKRNEEIEILKQDKISIQNKLNDKSKLLQEYTSAFPEELHKYLNMINEYDDLKNTVRLNQEEKDNYKVIIKKLELRVKNKNETIISLRGEVKEYSKLIKELEEQIKLLELKNKFLESKLPKKTLEEIVAYTFSQKEVLKRSKKNDRQD